MRNVPYPSVRSRRVSISRSVFLGLVRRCSASYVVSRPYFIPELRLYLSPRRVTSPLSSWFGLRGMGEQGASGSLDPEVRAAREPHRDPGAPVSSRVAAFVTSAMRDERNPIGVRASCSSVCVQQGAMTRAHDLKKGSVPAPVACLQALGRTRAASLRWSTHSAWGFDVA